MKLTSNILLVILFTMFSISGDIRADEVQPVTKVLKLENGNVVKFATCGIVNESGVEHHVISDSMGRISFFKNRSTAINCITDGKILSGSISDGDSIEMSEKHADGCVAYNFVYGGLLACRIDKACQIVYNPLAWCEGR